MIRLYNAKILTMVNSDLIDGEIWVDNNVISYIGLPKSDEELSRVTFEKSIDCNGNLLMPGFKNAHTHTAMTFSRSLADNYQLNDWLFKAIFPMEAKLTPEHIYWFTKLGYLEYLKTGTTACFDMYFHPDSVASAAVEMGFRNVFCCSVNDFGGIDRVEDEYKRFNAYDSLVSYRLGFHAEYTTSKEILNKISEYAHEYEAPVYAHISETSDEVKGCIERYGKTPVVMLNELGMFDFGGGGFHCVWLSDEDIEIFKEKNLYAVLNASSNLKLASGIAPVSKFISNGLNLAVGTDGAGSNNSLNMFREIYLDTVLSNIKDNSACAVNPFDILKASTSGGALCMGLNDCDILAVNKKADIIMIDLHNPNMRPVNNTVNNIVYSGDPSNVLMTMIDGKILYHNGEFLNADVDKIYSECERLLKGMKE